MKDMITIAIVEDIKDIREGLRLLIGNSDGFSCTEIYENAEEAIINLPKTQPDVVLMDINLPGKNGIDAVRILKEKCPSTQFIMSTVYEDSSSIFDSLKAGANGYLLKKTAPVKILEAIVEVYNGGSPMSTQIARKVITSFQEIHQQHSAEILTPKEKEILKGLSEGLRFKEIASEMHIGMETVRTHVRHIYEKLQVPSRTEALNKVFGKR
jgi:DNA-binding NarL/FixJ family response regulator